jgi:protein O-GlcNAc transferase
MRSRPESPGKRAIRLVRRGAYAAALPLLRRAMGAANPGAELRFALARSLFHLGHVHAALVELRRIARSPDTGARRAALGKIAVYVPGDPSAGNDEILEARRRWSRLESGFEGPPLSPTARRPGRKLRIGYVSAFLFARNWMKPVWGVLDAHDRRAFEIHLFLDRGLPDRRHGYAPHGSDHIHAIDNLSNEAAARCVARAEVDILVDLNAYSYPGRLGLFLRKPAPVQVGWFALYATSGIDALDYAVADRTALPAREERFCSERMLFVSGSYLVFAVPYAVPRVVAPPCARSGRITFGCLAPQYKMTDEVIATFARILRGAPGTRLILRNNAMTNGGNIAHVRARFARHGITRDRLTIEGPAEHLAFLGTYDRVDVALDTFPYSGATTTTEALWQGVPVLTFSGDRWVSRTSSSILHAAGLGEWICPSREAFVRRAVALAKSADPAARLSALRTGMRKRLLASRASDVRGLCRELENHYRAIARAAL